MTNAESHRRHQPGPVHRMLHAGAEVPSTLADFAVRLLIVTVVLCLAASFILLAQVHGQNAVITDLRHQVVQERHERLAYQQDATERGCLIVRNISGLSDSAIRDVGCSP